MSLQVYSDRAEAVLKPIDQLHGRRLGDTELIDAIRALLGNADYVFNTTAFADAVLDKVLHIKALLADRKGTVNISCTPEGNTALHVACKTIPARPDSVPDEVWMSEAAFKKTFRVRNDIIRMLLEAGGNPFLTNNAGGTCIDIAPEGPPRESLVAFLLDVRAQTETAVLSVPPLDASRLMKRSKGDSGYAIFSSIAKHCVYYLYKGGIYLWDVLKDIEHVVYQPRESDPMITSLEQRFAGFERRKSLAVTGQNVGGGKWTSKAHSSSTGESIRASFDTEEGDDILRRLALLESKVALVGNFTLTTGIDAKANGGTIPKEGVMEWVICNTGAVIGVKLNEEGVCLRHGHAQASPRRQSQVCGSAADYPEGMTLDTNLFQNCAIRFSRRNNASHICCAFDGLRRKVAYVVAVKRSQQPSAQSKRAEEDFCGFDKEGPVIRDDHSSARNSVTSMEHGGEDGKLSGSIAQGAHGGHKRVSFTCPAGDEKPFAASTDAVNYKVAFRSSSADSFTSFDASTSGNQPSKVFALEENGAIFRVCDLKRRAHPKENLEDVIDDLCNSHGDPFTNGAIESVDFVIPPHYGDPVCISQCGDDLFILYCLRGVIVADATEVVGKTVATFHDITPSVNLPEGVFILFGTATAPQRYRPIKSSNPQKMFAVQTDEVELLTIDRSPDGQILVHSTLRIPKDRVTPHTYTMFFHTARDEFVVMYQSSKRTEVTSYNFDRRTYQSLCKLPKPSSLRFFPSTKEDGTHQDLPQSVFALAADAPYLLRYNVTMHVMSVYSWEEIIQKQENKKIAFVPSIFLRDPKAMVSKAKLTEMITKYASPAQVFSSMPCAWLIVECPLLQRLVRDGGLVCRDKAYGISASPAAALADSINATLHNTFLKVVTGASGKVIQYQPPPFIYMPSEDEELDSEEIALLEEEYFHSRPRHEGVWCAYFSDIGDALRTSLQLHRALSKDAKWDDRVLELPEAREVRRPYQVKSEVERKHGDVLKDREETPFDQRGPLVRALVVEATTTTPPTQLLKAHRMETDTKTQFPTVGEPVYPPIAQNGVTVVPTKAMGVLAPILPIVTVTTPQTKKLKPVKPISGDIQEAGRGTVFKPIENNLTLIVPFELRARLDEGDK